MLNEYTYVLIEILLSILCLIISHTYIHKKEVGPFNWKQLGMKCIYFIWLILLMILYVIEYYEDQYLFIRYFILFMSILLITICIINIFNFIFNIFIERKHKRIHFILNFVEYCSNINIKRLCEIKIILEASFLYLMLFSIGSMILSFITSYLFNMNHIINDIYLLEVGPHFILFFIVLALSIWCVSLLVTLIYHKCMNAHIKDMTEEKVINQINMQKEEMKW